MTFEGGFSKSRFPVKSTQIDTMQHGKVTFVHCEKNAEWILQGAVGAAEKATLKRSKLFDTLKEKLKAAVQAETEAAAVAAADDAEDAPVVDDDPMNQLRGISTPVKGSNKPKKRKCYKSKLGTRCPRTVTIPAREPNKYPHDKTTRNVLVVPLGTNSVYICEEDVPWMITWLADECGPGGSKGVPMFDDHHEEPNSKVEGLYIHWDPTAWEPTLMAEGVAGPLQGKSFKLELANFTDAKWDTVDKIHRYGVPLTEATLEQKKAAAEHYIEWHCAQLLRSA